MVVGSFCVGCEDSGIRGCMSPDAINYNPNATVDNQNCVYPRSLTQEQLDYATVVYKLDRTGDFKDPENNLFSSFAHVDFIPSNRTFRDTYSNIQLKGATLSPGVIIVHQAFDKSIFGQKDTVMSIGVMYKQVRGYYPEGNDWEYIDIDIQTKSKDHPNGLLPPQNSERRGKLGKCSGCHLQAKGDYLYSF